MSGAFKGNWGLFFKWLQRKVFVQTYKSQETKDFFKHVWSAVNKLNARKRWPHNLKMTMFIHPPDRRRRDSSNLWKMVEDALMEAEVFVDDSQITEHRSVKSSPVKGGLVIVEIEVLL